MSAISQVSSTVLSAAPDCVKYLSFLKCQPRGYRPWKKPVSEKHLNISFEQQILPKLSALLENIFQEWSDLDREEAVQDTICQALETYRLLRLHEFVHRSHSLDETTLVLAKFASSQYLAGVRFAACRCASSL